MAVDTGVCILAVIAVTSCCLSVFNHFRYESLMELKISEEEKNRNTMEILSRARREVTLDPSASSSDSNAVKMLFSNITELKTFIQEEINQSIHSYNEMLKEFFSNVEESMRCKCPNSSFSPAGRTKGGKKRFKFKGVTGLRGPPGPPGPRGERGLGLYPPELKNKSITLVAKAGEERVFKCEFFGNPLPRVRWQTTVSDKDIKQEIDREESVITSHLYVRNITWEDRGEINCSASNLLGTTHATGMLTVHALPIISLPSEPLIGTLGMTITFPECKVISSTPVNITWQRGFLSFPIERTFKKNGILRISDLKVKDEGYYSCIAENYLGTTTKYIHLRARPLEFTEKPSLYVYRSNSSVTLSCAAYGIPGEIFGTWSNSVNGHFLQSTKKFRKKHEFIMSTVIDKSGKYRCSITNNVTTIESGTDVELFDFQSSLVDSKQVNTLGRWLGESDSIGKYRLCWSASKHGFDTTKFRSRCAGKPNTISIMKLNQSTVIGGFTDLPWRFNLHRATMTEMTYSLCESSSIIRNPAKISYRATYASKRRFNSMNEVCTWKIRLQEPMELQLLSKTLGSKTHCDSYDYIKVKEKGKESLLCGTDKQSSFISTSGEVTLLFGIRRRVYTTSIHGFSLMITKIDYGYSSMSFVFTFQPRAIRIPVSNKERAICYLSGYGVCFGEMELYHKGLSIDHSIGKSYKSYHISSLSTGNHSVMDMEVHYRV